MASGKQHIKFTFMIIDWVRFTYNYGNVKTPEFSYGFKWIPYSRLISLLNGKKTDPYVYYIRQGSLYEKGEYPIDDYLLQTEQDTIKMADQVMRYFKSIAFPYLGSICNLESLDKMVNNNPSEPTAGVMGLILGKLNNNPEYNNLNKGFDANSLRLRLKTNFDDILK